MKKGKVDFLNNLGKNLERRWKPKFLGNFHFNKCLNFTMYLIFTLVTVILIKTIINNIIPTPPPSPLIDKGSVLLFSYNGLPLIFWILLGIGLALGLCFHGFKLFSINVERKK